MGEVGLNEVTLRSSADPNGISFLLNCLIELRIRVEVFRDLSLWHKNENEYIFNPTQHPKLARWLPSIHARDSFHFIPDKVVYFSHDFLFEDKRLPSSTILFVRDPRDSLFSAYRREGKRGSYLDYLNSLDTTVILPRIKAWNIFYRSWIQHGVSMVQRYEDLKLNPVFELKRVLKLLGVGAVTENQLIEAIHASSFEQAHTAETELRLVDSNPTKQFNHRGIPFEWKLDQARTSVNLLISEQTEVLLNRFGYDFFCVSSKLSVNQNLEPEKNYSLELFVKENHDLYSLKTFSLRLVIKFFNSLESDFRGRLYETKWLLIQMITIFSVAYPSNLRVKASSFCLRLYRSRKRVCNGSTWTKFQLARRGSYVD